MARRRGNGGAKHAVRQRQGAEEARRAGNGAEGEVGGAGGGHGHGLVGLAVVAVRTGTGGDRPRGRLAERQRGGRMLVADDDVDG